MAIEIKNIRSKPLYDSTTGKLLGWDLEWDYVSQEFGCLGSVAPDAHFFEERWYRNSYKVMCRFRNNLLAKRNENNK